MLQPEQFFHGTTAALKPGDVISPSVSIGKKRYHLMGSGEHAHATSSADTAWSYAEMAHGHEVDRRPRGPFPVPRVYEVEPMGEYEQDPTYNANASDVRSKHGFRILNEHQMPEHMGKPEDWTS